MFKLIIFSFFIACHFALVAQENTDDVLVTPDVDVISVTPVQG